MKIVMILLLGVSFSFANFGDRINIREYCSISSDMRCSQTSILTMLFDMVTLYKVVFSRLGDAEFEKVYGETFKKLSNSVCTELKSNSDLRELVFKSYYITADGRVYALDSNKLHIICE